jgi:hypothetical protein
LLEPTKLPTTSPLFNSIATPRKRLLLEAKELFEPVFISDHNIALVNDKYVHALISTGTMLIAKMKLVGSQVLLPKYLVQWAYDMNLSIVLYVQVNRRFYFFDPLYLIRSAKDYKRINEHYYKFTLNDISHSIGVRV